MKTRTKSRSLWNDFIWINGVVLLLIGLIVASAGCGTGTGNPETASSFDGAAPSTTNFDAVISEYLGAEVLGSGGSSLRTECGSYVGNAPPRNVDAGRNCIRTSLTACQEARYLLDETLTDGSRFVSFVAVEITGSSPTTCQLRVHTVSSDPNRFVGSWEAACASVGANEEIELACDFGD